MNRIVRAFPLRPGKEAELNAFIAALKTERSVEARQFYKSLGVLHESWHCQRADGETQVIVLTVIDDANLRTPLYAVAKDEFFQWFKSQVFELTGVDPNVEPKGPPTEEVFNFTL